MVAFNAASIYAASMSRFGNLPDLYTFEGRACGVSHPIAAMPSGAPGQKLKLGRKFRAATLSAMG
jgi:hypothetical protein